MIKHLVSSLGVFRLAWTLFQHPKFGPLLWMFSFMFWFVFFLVPIPVKDKTGLEIVVATYYEVWRQDANATQLFLAHDQKAEIQQQCKNLQDLIYRTEQSKWAIMGSAMPSGVKAVELAKINARLQQHIKKLENAESSLESVTLSFKELLAKR